MDMLLRLAVLLALAAPMAAGGYILKRQKRNGWRGQVFIGIPAVLIGFVPWFIVMITGSDAVNLAVVPAAWALSDLAEMYTERRQRRLHKSQPEG